MAIARTRSCALILALTCICGTTIAQTQPADSKEPSKAMVTQVTPLVPPEDRNAAIAYLLAMQNLPTDFVTKAADIDYDACGTTRESLDKNEKFKAAVAVMDSFNAGTWVKASQLRTCDFQWAREEGFALLLPHLGKMRTAARSLRFLARQELGNDNPAKAAEYLATMVRMSNHITGDGFLISSLVGVAITSLSMTEMQTLAQSGRLDEPSRKVLLDALETINKEDPFLMRACIDTEEASVFASIIGKYQGPDAGRHFAKEMLEMNGSEDTATQLRAKILDEWDGDRLEREAQKAHAAFDAIRAAWDDKDPVVALAEAEARASREEFGVVAAILCPAMGKARQSSLKVCRDIEETIALIKTAKLATDAAPASAAP
ncbi:MAG: hypothetical protein NTV94_00135 [Planctomycetota bacterium]|nr:hypothetical protein [Planctomycetota bacterium]